MTFSAAGWTHQTPGLGSGPPAGSGCSLELVCVMETKRLCSLLCATVFTLFMQFKLLFLLPPLRILPVGADLHTAFFCFLQLLSLPTFCN